MPCHTGDKAKPYAGGLPLNTPFGTLYSVNITSDPTTGIGKWSYEQFRRALHDGKRADGSYLYPAMPFDAYTGIKDDDLKALWAYVRRIPAGEGAQSGQPALVSVQHPAGLARLARAVLRAGRVQSPRPARATNGIAALISSTRWATARTATARATFWAR